MGVLLHARGAKLMEPQKYGKIINIASIAGISTGSTHRPDAVLKEAARQRRIEVLIERE